MMKRILLYGDSVFLGGLAAQLQAQDDVIIVQQASHEGPLKLGDLDAVIVDFNDVDADDVLAILRASPDLKVVGVNAPGGAVTVLSGKVYLAHTLEDVVGCLD
ncbi:MAG: hypothetical protein GVY30_01615 [Chloroflexi bacterium]|jgi:hypothetical protein|nr:hypothetical protein [Chloroflexota bacterium]